MLHVCKGNNIRGFYRSFGDLPRGGHRQPEELSGQGQSVASEEAGTGKHATLLQHGL